MSPPAGKPPIIAGKRRKLTSTPSLGASVLALRLISDLR